MTSLTGNGLSIFGNVRPENALLTRAGIANGKSFYVDTAGADTNGGLSPDDPLLTLQAAIDKCTDDAGDYVFVLDCYASDTPPILFNSATSHVIGLSLPTSWGWAALVESADDLITLSGNYMEIAGFSLAPTGKDAIHVSTSAGAFCWLHNLNFGAAAGTTVNAIEFDGTSAFTNSLIEDCFFGLTTSSISGYAITGNGIQYTVRKCFFKNCNTKCINSTAPQGGGGYIHNNMFFDSIDNSPPAGWAITLDTGNAGWLVTNNVATTAGLATGNNPYEDNSSGASATQKNGWGFNYHGITLVDPLHSGE